MIPPGDASEQAAALEAGLSRFTEPAPAPDAEQLALQAHAHRMVRSPLWDHLRDRARMEVPHMLSGYRHDLAHLGLARMGVAALIRYVEDLAAAHQEAGE